MGAASQDKRISGRRGSFNNNVCAWNTHLQEGTLDLTGSQGKNRSSRPILVTGTHRSGTTWVGKMLSLHRSVHYIHEPFAPMYERAWLLDRPTIPYIYVPPDSYEAYQAGLNRILSLTPDWVGIGRRAHGVRNWVRLAQEAYSTSRARRMGSRPLVKDPFLLLSVEWFARQSSASPIILVRHPAAFAGSIKRLGWRLDPGALLNQPELMSRLLYPYQHQLEIDRSEKLDIVQHACLVWRSLNSVVRYYEEQYPHWSVVRYEDLAADPVGGFRGLYDKLDIPWTDQAERAILTNNSNRNPSEVAKSKRGSTRRNSSAAMWTWLSRLTEAEIELIRKSTVGVAEHWYGDEYWPD